MSSISKQDFLLSHPYYRIKEEQRIAKIHDYFNNLRYKIIATCIPSIYAKDNGEIDWVYPEYIYKAMNQINNMQEIYLKDYYDTKE